MSSARTAARYIDYVGSWGPMILGHAHPDVIRAVQERAALGLSFGAPTATRNASSRAKSASSCPSIELVRMVSSGTEATMSAIRLARGFTGRDKIVKFEGCYHGHSDSLLVKAGSGALTLGRANFAGRAAGAGRAHDHARLQRHRAGAADLRRHGRADRLRHRRADRRQHELRAARARLPGSAAHPSAISTAPC